MFTIFFRTVILRKISKYLIKEQWKASRTFLVELASKPHRYIYDIWQRNQGSDSCWECCGIGANDISQMHPMVSKWDTTFQVILFHHAEQRHLCSCIYSARRSYFFNRPKEQSILKAKPVCNKPSLTRMTNNLCL